jgi:hypothetical protein
MLDSSRSSLSNGRLSGVDGRTKDARRFRDLVEQFSSDVGGVSSEAERQLVKSAATLVIEGEKLQARCAAGEEVDASRLGHLANASLKILRELATFKKEAARCA